MLSNISYRVYRQLIREPGRVMRGSIEGFIRRLFATPPSRSLFRDGTPAGRELSGDWRFQVEYALAEMGYGLRADVSLRGRPNAVGERAGRILYQNGTLLITRGATRDGHLVAEYLHLDLPYALIDRPRCWREGTPAEKVAARIAAA